MTDRFNVRLSNPVGTLFWSMAMFLLGVLIGAHSHPSHFLLVATGVASGVFMVLHELVSGLLWCSITAWWIRRRTEELKDNDRK